MPEPSHKHLPYSPYVPDQAGARPKERIKIDPSNPAPYRWICHLEATIPHSKTPWESATGFLINIPGSSVCVILTAGHALYCHSGGNADYTGYAETIKIIFPQQFAVTVKKDSLKVHKLFRDNRDLEHDFGIIILQDCEKDPFQSCGFGLAALLTDRRLLDADLNIFGYPKISRSEGSMSMWGSGGRVQSLDDKMIRFLVETSEGQSGAPVYIWEYGLWRVVGIHVNSESIGGYTMNAAVRLTPSVIGMILHWITYRYAKVSLRFHDYGFLSIPKAAPHTLGESAIVKTIKDNDDTTHVTLIPVLSFPEGCNFPFRDIQWVVARYNRDHIDTYLSIDRLAGAKDDTLKSVDTVVVRARLRKAPRLRRPPELVCWGGNEPPKEGAKSGMSSVRFESIETPMRIFMDRFNLADVVIVENSLLG